MKLAGLAPAFSTWKGYIFRHVAAQQVEVREVLEQKVVTQREVVERAQRVMHKAQAKALMRMMSAGQAASWRKWRAFVHATRRVVAVAEVAEHHHHVEELQVGLALNRLCLPRHAPSFLKS